LRKLQSFRKDVIALTLHIAARSWLQWNFTSLACTSILT